LVIWGAECRLEGKVAQIAKNLQAMGLDETAIMQATGLTAEEINDLNNL
jgi:predicted transposase YdaD